MRKQVLAILLLSLCTCTVAAQSYNPHDTNYVRSYNDRFSVGLYQSYRELQYNMQETLPENDTSVVTNALFIAPSRNSTGFSFSYDKISVSFGFTTPASDFEKNRYGSTEFFSLGLNFTSGKHRVETFYRKISGFYDKNSELRSDDKWNNDSIYFQRPDMTTWVIKARGFRFFNQKKFSYGSAYVNNYRQIKTAGSAFLMGDVYYNEIRTSDYYLSRKISPMWGSYENLNFMNFYGASVGFGYTFNLVLWKTLYLNLLADIGMNLQHRQFKTLGHTLVGSDWKFGLAQSDLRAAFGVNGRSFFWSASFQLDNTVYKWKDFKVSSLQFSTFANIGYRFKVKDRKWNTWLRSNKIYNWF